MTYAESQVSESQFSRYIKSLLAGEKAPCSDVVFELLEKEIDIKDIYINVFQRSMYEIGTLWEHNKISVATEHLATVITESLLNLIYPHLFSTRRVGQKVVICCVTHEYHQIGGKMVADIFEFHGWDGYFLGANTPLTALIEFVQEKQPHLVGFSLSIPDNRVHLEKVIDAIQIQFNGLDIIVGGQAFLYGVADMLEQFPDVRYISGLHELESMVIQKKEENLL
jgi:methanogenic corrinoid protein MtbC1